jgi:hypothetical protein
MKRNNKLPEGGGLKKGDITIPRGKAKLKRGGGLKGGGGMEGVKDSQHDSDDDMFFKPAVAPAPAVGVGGGGP